MATEKLEWLPAAPSLIGISVYEGSPTDDSLYSGKNGVFRNWNDALTYIADCYDLDVEAFIVFAVDEVAEVTRMSSRRVWGQWFKREPRKLITWMYKHDLIRVLWVG